MNLRVSGQCIHAVSVEKKDRSVLKKKITQKKIEILYKYDFLQIQFSNHGNEANHFFMTNEAVKSIRFYCCDKIKQTNLLKQ